MIDFDAMVKNETMGDVILFLVSHRENGIDYPTMDRFFGKHKAAEKYKSYNIKLIHEVKHLEELGRIFSGKTYIYQKGPNWQVPAFVAEKKYGVE
uniref:hypothetical protein n=1 Tax=Pantoea sp. IMH TaxID=1267600 RepID=UPI0004698E6A|nr:hypothetical protein [Pantoea sp. IMH]